MFKRCNADPNPTSPTLKRLAAWFVGIASLFTAAIALTGWILARPHQCSVGAAPADLNAEPVSFDNERGIAISGWWCPVKNSRASVLLLPGIRANRLSMVDRARFLRAAGYSTLLIDLQGTGETKGDHITFGWNESHDVAAAVAFLHEHSRSTKVAVIGSSLGGAAALFATPSTKFDAMVLEAVYPTIEIATRNRLQRYLGRAGPRLSPLLLLQLKPRTGIDPKLLRPIDYIAGINCPVMILSGRNDPNTRIGDSSALFDAAKNPKKLWTIAGAQHVDLYNYARAEYERRVLAFLEEALNLPRPAPPKAQAARGTAGITDSTTGSNFGYRNLVAVVCSREMPVARLSPASFSHCSAE